MEENTQATDKRSLEPGRSSAEQNETKSAIMIDAQPAVDLNTVVAEAAANKISSSNFQVDTSQIHSVPSNEQAAELQNLGLEVFNQDQFESGE